MKKLLVLVAISFMLLGIGSVQARNSAASYDAKYYSQQEFVQAYNNTTSPIYRDYVVGLDTSPTINPNVNLGQYVTAVTSATSDNIYVFGVADETIPAGQLGRFCIRGPHKIVVKASQTSTIGTVLSQCPSNTAAAGGLACAYATATGTAAGMIGYVINATATSDTGDVVGEYWSWVTPQILR